MSEITEGVTVEYLSVKGKVSVKVLKVKADGKLILDTRQLGLCKNVCVLPHRVKILK